MKQTTSTSGVLSRKQMKPTAAAYCDVLIEEFSRRRLRNSAYSLRAYARDLSWSSSRLSEVLRGKAGLGPLKARVVAERLGLAPERRAAFLALVEASQTRKIDTTGLSERHELASERFAQIQAWFHFAILELSKLKEFRSSSPWIARRLGIHPAECRQAIERLLAAGLLRRQGGRLRAEARNHHVASPVPSAAIRNFHRQLVGKALDAIDLQSVDQRYLTTSIVAVQRARLPELCRRLEALKREFCTEAEKGAVKDAVYGVSMQFFELAGARKTSPTP